MRAALSFTDFSDNGERVLHRGAAAAHLMTTRDVSSTLGSAQMWTDLLTPLLSKCLFANG